MFINTFIIVLVASVFPSNTIVADQIPPQTPIVPASLAVSNDATDKNKYNGTSNVDFHNNATNYSSADTSIAIEINNTTNNKNTSDDIVANTTIATSTAVESSNNVNNVTVNDNTNTNTNTSISIDRNNTATIKTVDIINNATNVTADPKIAAEQNNTGKEKVLESNNVDHQQKATPDITLDHSDITQNKTGKQTISLNGTSSLTNSSSTVKGQQTTNINSTRGNVIAKSSDVHSNVSSEVVSKASSQENAASNHPSSGHLDRKWQAILITAAVVIAGCCGVLLVRRTLKSERGRAWAERTLRQTNVPCRDYEVEYLTIRDEED